MRLSFHFKFKYVLLCDGNDLCSVLIFICLTLHNKLILFDFPRACMSTGPQQQHGTFYEFRTYSIQPEKNVAFGCPMRRSTWVLLTQCYWSMEYGGLNQVFPHLEVCYAQRAGVRASLAQDPNWIAENISKAMPMLTSQDNEVTYLVPWSKVESLPKDGGDVCKIATYKSLGKGVGEVFQAAVSAHAAGGHAHLVGVFHSEFGWLNNFNALWWYESPDQRAAVRHKAHGDARLVAPFSQYIKNVNVCGNSSAKQLSN
uniref:Nipsnap homolog 3A (C. elegans) n=1 Tax=Oncorhynchus kisutch TaxID=8019 RepID=A0A8C7FL62_ONCKI